MAVTEEPEKSPPAKKQKTQPRRYGFACLNCRRRKSKCNGVYPTCDKCINNKEECNYTKGPSVAYAISLESQLQSYKDHFEQLRTASSSERLALLEEFISNAPTTEIHSKTLSDVTTEVGDSTRDRSSDSLTRDGNGTIEQPEETSVGMDGEICFYGKTSLYHVEPREDGNEAPISQDEALQADQATTEHNPSTVPYSSPAFSIGHDITAASVRFEISPTTFNELLTAYWCLPHHLHLVLCKPLFLRDLNTAGPYMTPFLLSAVLTQAARYCNRPDSTEIGNHFASRALQLLPQDIDRGSQIPTIQGLLILSSREVACGRIAQGWLYSGMAFRMMRDLGIHVAPKKLGHFARQFSKEDLSLRQQVFWSCYTWDKTMSLCLGRAPIIHDVIEIPTPDTIIGGHTGDEEIWVPLPTQTYTLKTFPTQRALSSTRFTAYCELTTIIDDVLDKLYSKPRSERDVHLLDYLTTALGRLGQWSSKLPGDLFIHQDCTTVVCPPLHILLLNLLYRATTILLCRPYRSKSQRARSSCTEAARMIDVLFTLHVRRFGFNYITYLQTYTMFVACTINVLDFRENQNQPRPDGNKEQRGSNPNRILAEEAGARVDFGLEVLRQARSTPSAARCAAIIARMLSKADDDTTGSSKRPSRPSVSEEGAAQGFHPSPHSIAKSRETFDNNDRSAIIDDRNRSFSGGYDPERVQNGDFRSPQSRQSRPSFAGEPFYQRLDGASLPMEGGPSSQLPPMNYLSPANGSTLPSQENFDLVRDHVGPGVIETPLRWLPENMQDDGSWMLMDEGDPYGFMNSY